MSYYGDIRLGKTIDIKFTTRKSTGLPTTLSGSPVISAYPDNSTTQLTAGITLTVDFDGVTGYNNVRVVATGGNGYATTTNYDLAITTGTVDSISVVGESIGGFSIENRSALMPTTADRTAVVDANGLIDSNMVKAGPTGAGTAQTARDLGGQLDAAITTRAAASTALTNATWTDARAAKIDNLDATISGVPAAVWAVVCETGVTVLNAMKALLAVITSTSSGFPGAGAKVFTNPAGTKNRVTITTDANGNRTSAPTYDFT